MTTTGYREIYIDNYQVNDEVSVNATIGYDYTHTKSKSKRHGYCSECDDPDEDDIEVGKVYITNYQYFNSKGIEIDYQMTNQERFNFQNYVDEFVENDSLKITLMNLLKKHGG